MRTKWLIGVIAGVAFVGVVLTGALVIPTEKASAQNGPGVARVSVVAGAVTVQRGDSHTQTSAVLNAPMLPGDYIATGKASRAELQFDGYTAVRLDGNVQARIVSNDPDNRKVQLAEGTVEIGIVHDGATMLIDTPSITVRAHQAGDYRISVGADGSSWVTVRRGRVDVVTPQGTNRLDAGRTLVARGPASNPSITGDSGVAFDSFDDVNVERDNAMVAALNASPNLNPGIAGYDNLDDYGQWQTVAGYGQSWLPNEPAGWVPYREGSWTWESGYGWTWVSAEPWGWAPYHYGNWYFCNCGASGWAWLPPAHASTPSWSPALVGFFGFSGAGSGVEVAYNNCGGNYGYVGAPAAPYGNGAPAPYGEGGATPSYESPAPYGEGGAAPYGEGGPGNGYGNPEAPYTAGYPPPNAGGYPYPYIGWVPIAPYEPFYPWYPGWVRLGFGWGPRFGGYGYPARFATRIVNITNITRIYRNFHHRGATGTTIGRFRHGTIFGHTHAVTARDLGRHSGTIRGALPVKPTRDNLAFTHGTLHSHVAFSRAFNSPRFALERALAARPQVERQEVVAHAVRSGRTGHTAVRAMEARATEARADIRVSHVNAPARRENPPARRAIASASRVNTPESRVNAPLTRASAQVTRREALQTRTGVAVTRGNAAASRFREASRLEIAPAARENTAMRDNDVMSEGSRAPHQVEAGRHEFAPSGSWQRFSEARGDPRSVAAGSEGPSSAAGAHESDVSAPHEAGRQDQTSSDPWDRFSSERGDISGPASSERGESSERNPYERNSSERNPYERNSSERNPYERNSSERNSYRPYGRGSYPSYSRESHPSYSYGPSPSYSRGAPSGGGRPPSDRSGGQHRGARPPKS